MCRYGSIIPLAEEMSQEIIHLKAKEIGSILNSYAADLEFMAGDFAEGKMIDLTQADNPITRAAYQEIMRNDIRRRGDNLKPEYVSILFADLEGNFMILTVTGAPFKMNVILRKLWKRVEKCLSTAPSTLTMEFPSLPLDTKYGTAEYPVGVMA